MVLAALFTAFIIWLLAVTPVFIGLMASIAELCHGLFTKCLGLAALARMAFLWAGGLMLLSGLVFASLRAALVLLKSRRAVKRLPVKDRKANLRLIEDRALYTAFTHGIIRPRIYISRGLMESLGAGELRAVLHHELSHKKNRDTLRFFLLSILKDAFFFIPLGAYLYGRVRDRQEQKADDEAASSMDEPFSIAGALVKLAGTAAARPLETASILGRGGEVEDRVRRLVGEEPLLNTWKGLRIGTVLVSLIVPLFMLISLAMPLKAALGTSISTCATSRCVAHKGTPDKHCHTHCEKTGRLKKSPPLKTLSEMN